MQAEVGDEFYGDDLAILELQDLSTELLGKAQGLFLPSGTMANPVGVLAHTNKGDMLILDALSHLYRAECANFTVVGGLLTRPVDADQGVRPAPA